MALSEKDLEAIRLLMREEIGAAISTRVDPRFNQVNETLEVVLSANEKREQEYELISREQLPRLEKRVKGLEETEGTQPTR